MSTNSQNTSFRTLYKKFSPPLYKFIAKRTGADEKVVEEILEEVLVAAWKGYKTFEHKSSYFTWLCRIALNKIADYYRDQINERSRFITPTLKAVSLVEADDLLPEEKIVLDELRNSVNKCLDSLPLDKRRLLWFRYWKNLSYQEIARILDISERAVEGRLYRARAEFSKVWTSRI